MEPAVTTSPAASRSGGGSLQMASNRKKWRAVTDYHRHDHSLRNAADEEVRRTKAEQPDERAYEQTRDQVELDFRAMSVDESLDTNMLQHRIDAIANRRQELLLMEVDLRAQVIARKNVMDVQTRFESQLKEHTEFIVKLQEQLNDKKKILNDLERRMEEKERELHAIKLDNEMAWAKEDLLREQNKELMTIRREREHSENERVQHLQQIRDLQDRIQEKERQILDFQEQNRAAQETIFLKDEQLKAWISRVQEMDALQSSTNQSLQAQLRERTEQYNHLWLGCQRQFAEMERLHLHTIQQLQLEMSEARERSGSFTEEAVGADSNLKDASNSVHNNGNTQDFDGKSSTRSTNGVVVHSNADNFPFAVMAASNQGDHVTGSQIPQSSMLGVPAYFPHGQMQPFIMHQQGLSHSNVGHLHTVPYSPIPQWQNPQVDQNNMRSDEKFGYGIPSNGHSVPQMEPHVLQSSSSDTSKPTDASSLNSGTLHVSANFDQNNDNKPATANDEEGKILAAPLAEITSSQPMPDVQLLDKRSLLACIVRTIPTGGKIRMTSTLPTRLGKMLAPLSWHDYHNKYGKLEEFVATHPELFTVEGEFVQLREGAQAKIAATAAVAKVAAAASTSYSYLPSVAVTPISQAHRVGKVAPAVGFSNGKVFGNARQGSY